jgi:MYXO-CTERM domain-containing protein
MRRPSGSECDRKSRGRHGRRRAPSRPPRQDPRGAIVVAAMNRAILSLVLAASALLAAPRPVFADVVSPPPTSCPDGSEPATCHGGPHCRPRLCSTSAECGGGVCQDVSYCVKTISCAGKIPPDADPSQFNQDAVEKVCTGSCTGGAPCKSLKVCVSPGSSSASSGGGAGAGGGDGNPVSFGGCGCRAAGDSAGEALVAAALAAALGIAVRRRRLGDQGPCSAARQRRR